MMRQRLRLLLLVAAFASTPLSSAQPVETIALMDITPWRIAVGRATQPGILVQFSELLFAKQHDGDAVTTALALPPRRLLAELQSKKFQWTYLPCQLPMPGYLNVGVLHTTPHGVVVNAESPITELAHLNGRNLGVWAERIGLLPELENNAAIQKQEVNQMEAALKMLLERRLDAVAIAEGPLRWYLRQMNIQESELRFIAFQKTALCLFASDQLPPSRRDQIAQRLQQHQMTGRIEQIVAQYW